MHPLRVLGLIPARGGSKSIPHKNIVDLAGLPLLAYQVHAARRSGVVARLVCSTDDGAIAGVCESLGVEALWRPASLATDQAHVVDAMLHVVGELEARGETYDAVALFQPTSPFVTPAHVRACVQALANDPEAGSAQTVAPLPHNHHAYNQRVVDDGRVDFAFPEERARCYNKQSKPAHYVFGNLVLTRTAALKAGGGVFAQPSAAVEILAPYALDVDQPQDLELARFYLERGWVHLEHLDDDHEGGQR